MLKINKNSYTIPNGESVEELKETLKFVYEQHKDIIPYYETEGYYGFDGYIKLMAKDDFYNMHYVAKEYLRLMEK